MLILIIVLTRPAHDITGIKELVLLVSAGVLKSQALICFMELALQNSSHLFQTAVFKPASLKYY